MTSQIPKNQNYNAFTKVLLLHYNHNHGTHTYPYPCQHRVSSFKTDRPRDPCGLRCMGHAIGTWYAVCSVAPHSQVGEEVRPICAFTNGIVQHQFVCE